MIFIKFKESYIFLDLVNIKIIVILNMKRFLNINDKKNIWKFRKKIILKRLELFI